MLYAHFMTMVNTNINILELFLDIIMEMHNISKSTNLHVIQGTFPTLITRR
jgi:hypothetical protein